MNSARSLFLFGAFLLGMAGPIVVSSAVAGPLRVGAAKVEYTKLVPPPATPPLGTYEHEKLYIRAIVIDNGATRAALISVDGSATASIAAKVAEELKCPKENVIASGTHTHSSGIGGPPPAGGGAASAGGRDPQTSSPLDGLAVDAVRQAVAKLQPARMAFGTGASYLNVNRDTINQKTRLWTQDSNPTGPSDKTVAVLKFESLTGEPIALWTNYAMHPVNLYLGGITSADYPGAAMCYIERIYGGNVVALFAQGAQGDQNPLYLRASAAAMLQRGGQKYTGQPLSREAVEAEIRDGGRPLVPLDSKQADAIEKWIEAEGMVFAEEVLRVAQSLEATESDVRISGAQKTITCPGRVRTNTGREGAPGTYTDGPDVSMLVGVLGIGNVGLAFVNAEVYNAIGQAVKAKSPMARTVFVGLSNGRANTGYIPTDDAFAHNTFQVLGSRLKPGCAETSITNSMVEMLTLHAAAAGGTR